MLASFPVLAVSIVPCAVDDVPSVFPTKVIFFVVVLGADTGHVVEIVYLAIILSSSFLVS